MNIEITLEPGLKPGTRKMHVALALLWAMWFVPIASAITFRVKLDAAKSSGGGAVSGRLIVSLIKDGAKLPGDTVPNDAPLWDDPQPMFAIDVKDLLPGGSAVIDTASDSAFESLENLGPGTYQAQARLITARKTSNWRRDAGNFTGPIVKFTAGSGAKDEIALTLNELTKEEVWTPGADVRLVEFRSEKLSAFHKRDVMVRAGVVLPTEFDGTRKYAAVYEVPGFGGDYRSANEVALQRSKRLKANQELDKAAEKAALEGTKPPKPPSLEFMLDRNTFWIVLDPESPNGHTLFADSANNGPCGEALVSELIPELEKRFPLHAKPEARILRGHSSGGWSTLWLTLRYPAMFGATWSSSPDPVDFRRFQTTDIYAEPNMFTKSAGGLTAERCSFRRNGQELMTVRQENVGERIMGPDRTSGQQWASWQAVWGPRAEVKGRSVPAALFDAKTGVIDRAVAEKYRAYDIGEMVRSNPAKYAMPFFAKIRLVVGEADNFFLNEAVELLNKDLAASTPLPAPGVKAAYPGYVKIVPGRDHGTIFGSAEIRGFTAEMIEHLKGHELLARP